MPIRVIATDIDHTLIDDRGQLPPTNIDALRLAVSQGIKIVLATARRHAPTEAIAQKIGIPATCLCHNGARIWDEAGRELYHKPLEASIAQELAGAADDGNLAFVFTIDETNYYNPRASESIPWTDYHSVPSLRAIASQPPTRIVARGDTAISVLLERFHSDPRVSIYQYARAGSIYSAIAANPEASKERGLAFLCERWGITPAEVLSIGDADADAGMLRWAGVGVALTGSMPAALEAANWVAPSARLGGVAVAIHRYALTSAR